MSSLSYTDGSNGNGIRNVDELLRYFENNYLALCDHGFVASYRDLLKDSNKSVMKIYDKHRKEITKTFLKGRLRAVMMTYNGHRNATNSSTLYQKMNRDPFMYHRTELYYSMMDDHTCQSRESGTSIKMVEENLVRDQGSHCEVCEAADRVDPNCANPVIWKTNSKIPWMKEDNMHIILCQCAVAFRAGKIVRGQRYNEDTGLTEKVPDGFDPDRCKGPNCQMKGTLECGGCESVKYCSEKCQKKHWKEHKKYCAKLKAFTNRCNAPDCEKLGMIRCEGCKTVKYCSKKCQKKHWKRHKKACAKCAQK